MSPYTVPIYAGNKVIGQVVGEIFELMRRRTPHMRRVPQLSWAIDVASLEDAYQHGARVVHIFDAEEEKHYWCHITDFDSDPAFPLDSKEYGRQRALPLWAWQPSYPVPEGQMKLPGVE